MNRGSPILTVALTMESDIVVARQRARRIAELLGFDRQDQTRIATAVSEIARNAFSYGGGGRAEFALEGGDFPSLTVLISDKGPGIGDLDAVLSGRYVSPTGMGVGLVGARRLMDRFDIRSEPGKGVSVAMAKVLPREAPNIDKHELAGIADELRIDAAPNSSEELHVANQALMSSLADLRLRQDELAQLNAELEDTNRGVVALYAELDDAAMKLKAASEAKSRFLSHVSHEFRTPLNSILALSRILLDRLDGELSPEQERQVGYIRKSAESLTELVNDLLDIAKVEAGKIDLKVAGFEAAELFAGLRGVMKPLQANSAVDLIFDLPDTVPTLHADEARLAQILRNLISNALKFTERGEVRVALEIDDDEAALFTVSDTGVGIAADDHGRIFEEFEQVSGALQSRSRGTGLGLPLSKRLAELMGGSLTVRSTPNVGSVFTLRLPVDTRVAAAEPQRVLVVDDDEAFRYALRQMIGHDHEVFEAEDGEAAIQAIREHAPAVVFLDLNMPRLDGYAVLQELTGPDTQAIRVIVSTAAIIDERNRPRLARADFVLSKDQLSRETVAALIAGGQP